MWRARDTRLDREVAIKLLLEAFTEDGERLARFEREARVLASLNHQSIGGIYDLVECDPAHTVERIWELLNAGYVQPAP